MTKSLFRSIFTKINASVSSKGNAEAVTSISLMVFGLPFHYATSLVIIFSKISSPLSWHNSGRSIQWTLEQWVIAIVIPSSNPDADVAVSGWAESEFFGFLLFVEFLCTNSPHVLSALQFHDISNFSFTHSFISFQLHIIRGSLKEAIHKLRHTNFMIFLPLPVFVTGGHIYETTPT